MRIPAACLAAAVLVAACPAHAQEQDGKAWSTLAASLPLEERLTLDLEATARFSIDDEGLYETIQSLWLARELRSGATLSLGYQRNQTARTTPGTIENRLRQQVSGNLAQLGGGTLSGRLRFEQRFRSDGDRVHFRLRPQVAYSRPFTPGGATRWVVSHESFIGSESDWAGQTGYFRMRHQASIRTPISESVGLEFGYLNQLQFGREGDPDTMDHVALATLSFTP